MAPGRYVLRGVRSSGLCKNGGACKWRVGNQFSPSPLFFFFWSLVDTDALIIPLDVQPRMSEAQCPGHTPPPPPPRSAR